MKSFGINAENHISIYEGAATRPHEIIFATDEQLALVAEELPTSRLVEIWNNLPEVVPVKKFKDRKTAIARIWNALQNVDVSVQVTAEVAPEATTTEQPDAAQEPETAEQPEPTPELATEPETAPERDEPVAPETPQTPDVAPAGTELAKKANRAKKASKTPRSASSTREGSKTETVLALLKREGGVSLQELMTTTGWQAHSVRGFLSGTIGKKMGLAVISAKREDGTRAYSIGA